MDVARKRAVPGDFSEHRKAPRIAAGQPITFSGRQRAISLIASHPLIENTLRGKRRREVVRTPVKRHTHTIGILPSALHTMLDRVAVICREFLPLAFMN